MNNKRLIELGLCRRKSGSVYCPECEGGFVFNGGCPYLQHSQKCSRYNEPRIDLILYDKEVGVLKISKA